MPTPKGNFDCNISDSDIKAVSAEELLAKTRSFEPGQKVSPARLYEQCLPSPVNQEPLADEQNTGQPCDVNDHLDEYSD
jgi:hypothetical protein